MRTTIVDSFEAKTHFAELLERVAHREHVTITKHGTSLARLVPLYGPNPHAPKQAIRKLKKFRNGQTLWRLKCAV